MPVLISSFLCTVFTFAYKKCSLTFNSYKYLSFVLTKLLLNIFKKIIVALLIKLALRNPYIHKEQRRNMLCVINLITLCARVSE